MCGVVVCVITYRGYVMCVCGLCLCCAIIVRARRDSCAVCVVLCCVVGIGNNKHKQTTLQAETRSDNVYMYVASSFSAEVCPAQL